MRILIVEDDKDIGTLFSDYFKSKGHLVVLAEDGVTGFMEIWDKTFDIVITDLNMKMKGGDSLIKGIRGFYDSDIPVIVVSGFINSDFKESIKDQEKVWLVDKPITVQKLDKLVEEICKQEGIAS